MCRRDFSLSNIHHGLTVQIVRNIFVDMYTCKNKHDLPQQAPTWWILLGFPSWKGQYAHPPWEPPIHQPYQNKVNHLKLNICKIQYKDALSYEWASRPSIHINQGYSCEVLNKKAINQLNFSHNLVESHIWIFLYPFNSI